MSLMTLTRWMAATGCRGSIFPPLLPRETYEDVDPRRVGPARRYGRGDRGRPASQRSK
jgi:hypothetical protein